MQRPTRRSTAVLAVACLSALLGLGAVAPGAAGASPPPRAAAVAFPVTITSDGYTAHIRAKPVRILCLSPSATQMLYDIGAGSQVAAVDEYSTYPPRAPRTKLTGDETSAEDYLHYRPDLVIVAYNEGTMAQQLTKLGIPDLVLPPATNLAGVYAQLSLLGAATGHHQQAAAAGSSLQRTVTANVAAAHGKGQGQSYFIELDPEPLYTATSSTFIGAEFSLFGMRDIADRAGHGSAYPQLSAEYLLAQDPDWVFLADTVCCHATAKTFGHRPGFSTLKAVRDGHVVPVDDSVASQWGPHTVDQFTRLLAQRLNP